MYMREKRERGRGVRKGGRTGLGEGRGVEEGEGEGRTVLSLARRASDTYMMPQEDRGLAMWQVQADWQYWRTVW